MGKNILLIGGVKVIWESEQLQRILTNIQRHIPDTQRHTRASIDAPPTDTQAHGNTHRHMDKLRIRTHQRKFTHIHRKCIQLHRGDAHTGNC